MKEHHADIRDFKETIRGCYEQLHTNKFENLDEVDKYLENYLIK